MVTNKIYSEITGYCPYLEREHTIVLIYFELHLSGQLSPQYKNGNV